MKRSSVARSSLFWSRSWKYWRTNDEAGTVATADLIRVIIEIAAAAVSPAGSGLAVQHSIATLALPVIVHDRLAAE